MNEQRSKETLIEKMFHCADLKFAFQRRFEASYCFFSSFGFLKGRTFEVYWEKDKKVLGIQNHGQWEYWGTSDQSLHLPEPVSICKITNVCVFFF